MKSDVRLSADELVALGDAIAVAAATMDAAMHGLLERIRRFDGHKGWARQGAKSCAHWLSWRIGLGLGAAREKVRVARALGELPAIDEALRRGEVSYAKVRAMTRVATRDNEALLCRFARSSTGAQLERICRGLRQVQRSETGIEGRHAAGDDERFVRQRRLPSGLVRIELQLLPDEAAIVLKAIRAAACAERAAVASEKASVGARAMPAIRALSAETSASRSADSMSRDVSAETSGARQADAAVAVADSYLAHEPRSRSGGERTQLFVHLSEERLEVCTDRAAERAPGAAAMAGSSGWRAELADGSWLSGPTLLRLACDAGLVAAKVDGAGRVLDVGRKLRTVPPAMLRALWLRDGHCRFPGCESRLGLEAHHAIHWAHGGPTSLANLLLLCKFHHRALHEDGFGVETGEQGALLFRDPQGVPIARSAHAVPGDGIGALARYAAELDIEPRTNLPRWDGQPLDLYRAVASLCA